MGSVQFFKDFRTISCAPCSELPKSNSPLFLISTTYSALMSVELRLEIHYGGVQEYTDIVQFAVQAGSILTGSLVHKRTNCRKIDNNTLLATISSIFRSAPFNIWYSS